MAAKSAQYWEVVGGADKGGILVRSSRTASSPAFTDRLSFGAVVAELEQSEGRVHYELISGTGPESGWVTLSVSGKSLLVKTTLKTPEVAEKVEIGDICEVIGGVEKGGIVARRGQEGWSQIRGTLSVGARISIKANEGERFMYEMMEGSGPASAWIDSETDGKPLLAIITKAVVTTPANSDLDTDVGTSDADESDDMQITDVDTQSITQSTADCSAPDVADSDRKKLLKMYGMRMASRRVFGLKERLRFGALFQEPLSAHKRAELDHNLQTADHLTGAFDNTRQLTTHNWEDFDGETLRLCGRCMLPLGTNAYPGRGKGIFLHSECLAQSMLEQLRHEENKQIKTHQQKKLQQRMQFDIGWNFERIPRNAPAFAKLDLVDAPRGMCCLVYDEIANSIHLAATLEPAAALNMEYLSTALKAQLRDGCEPWFSLNAVDPTDKNSMMKKVFHPEWLKNTKLGEVLFQADYHLKELSMGEYDQPVVGMKSCFDLSAKEGHDNQWIGREWFVLNKAEVQLSDDNVIVPQFKLGVQAREMYLNGKGKFEDRPITRRNHPLVQYAQQFTQNFSLIAERKSVIFQLREVAKATIAAKFIMDSRVRLHDEMFNLADDVQRNIIDEIPRLWNMRGESQIEIKDGMIVTEADSGLSMNSVYGGVQLSVGRYIGAPRGLAPMRPAAAVRAGQLAPLPALTAVQKEIPKLQQLRAGVSIGSVVPSAFKPVVEPAITASKSLYFQGYQSRTAVGPAPGVREIAAEGEPIQGVDLNLKKFDLFSAKRGGYECAAPVDAMEGQASIGRVFLETLHDSTDSSIDDWQKDVLQDIYSPCMCDRLAEGDLFIPPATCGDYMKAIQDLLIEEQEMKLKRKGAFCRTDFKISDPGNLFPSSWTSSFAIANGDSVMRAAGGDLQPGLLQARYDFQQDPTLLERMRTSSSLIFDKTTEDSTRFRIYRVGSIELRSVEEFGGSEVVGAVFTILPAARASGKRVSQAVTDNEKLAKVTMYVEMAPCLSAPLSMPYRRYYTVFETVLGNMIVTELHEDGTTSWQENPKDLEKRNSLAKTFCTEDCSSFDNSVMDLKAYQMTGMNGRFMSCKHYAQGAYCKAVGQEWS